MSTRATAAPDRRDPPSGHAADLTWAIALPVTGLVVAVAVFLVPWLVPAQRTPSLHFFADAPVRPEPREQATFLVLLGLPPLLAGAAWFAARRRRSLNDFVAAGLALPVQALLVALVAVCWVRQLGVRAYVDPWQGVVAVLAGLAAGLLVLAPLGRPLPGWASRVRVGTRTGFLLGVVVTLAALSFSVFRGGNIAAAQLGTYFHLPFVLNEFAAVTAGLAPSVDFTAQYTFVLPYLTSPFFAAAGPGVLPFTTLMAVLSAVAFLSVLFVFSRVTGSWGWALALYLPFLSFSLFPVHQGGAQLYYSANYWAIMPLRYLGPFVTLAVCVWALGRPTPLRLVSLGCLAGLTLCNNIEFGLPAFAGVLFALLATTAERRVAALARLALGAAAGIVVFAGLTLAWSGALPNPVAMVAFARQFATDGFFLLPIESPLGLHVVGFLTYVACFVVVALRILRRTEPPTVKERSATAALAFAGVFGLGTAAYFVGRSDPEVLIMLFAAWSLALSLLACELVRHLRSLPAGALLRRATLVLPVALVAGHLALMATTLAWDRQILRQPGRLLSSSAPRVFDAAVMRGLVRDCATPGESVALLHPLGHVIADREGVHDVMPFSHPGAIATFEQVADVRSAIEDASVRRVFADGGTRPELREMLTRAGFARAIVRVDPAVDPNFSPVTGAETQELLVRGLPRSRACAEPPK